MALTVPQQWTATAFAEDAEIGAVPTPGNWLIATVAWRVTDGSAPSITIGDPSRNIWSLLYSTTTSAHAEHAASQLQIEIWACPAVAYDGWDMERVHVAAQHVAADDLGTVDVHVAEIAGFASGYLTVDSVTIGSATAAGSLSLSVPAPAGGANCLVFAAAAIDDASKTITVTGPSMTALTQVSMTAPDVELAPCARATTGASTASWSLASGTADWAGVAVAIRETGIAPAGGSADWPALRLGIGLGYDQRTPLTAVRFTDQTDRLAEVQGTATVQAPRGIPSELGVAQSEASSIAISNPDGAYTPRTPGSATANASGTTSTIKVPDSQATDIHASDFFHLLDSGGDLKELTVFQVAGLASSAGTTTITFARADGTGVALAATASGDQYEGVPVDLDMPYRVTMAWDGKVYPVVSGWLGQLPQTWKTPALGQVSAAGVDVLSTLTAAVPTVLAGEILRRRPSRYWPLSDPVGAVAAQDVSGNGGQPLTKTASKWGVGADATADFGASTQDVDAGIGTFRASLVGDPGSGWAQSGLTRTEMPTKGYALVAVDDDFPPIAGGVTLFGTILSTQTDITEIINTSLDPTIAIIRNSDVLAGAPGNVIKVAIDRTTLLGKVSYWDRTDHSFATTFTAASNQITGGDFRTWALTFNQSSWALYVDTSLVLSGSCNLAARFTHINVGGEADKFVNGYMNPSLMAHVAIFDRRLTAGEVRTLSNAVDSGTLSLETTSDRVRRKLATVNWKGPRVIPQSDIAVASDGNDGGTIADQAQDIASSDDGLMYQDAASQLQWRGHLAGYYQSVKAVLGEDEAAGEIPYQMSQRYGYDKTYLYNRVLVTNYKIAGYFDIVGTRFVAADADSAARRGERTLSMDTRLRDVNEVFGLAWSLLARYKDPHLRVGSVEIDAAANPDAWEFCLGVEVGDLVEVKRRPMGAPVISQTCRVLRVTPILGPGLATWVLELGAAPDPAVVIGDRAGTLGDGTIGW